MSRKPEHTSDTKPKDTTQTDAQGSASAAGGRTPEAADAQGSASSAGGTTAGAQDDSRDGGGRATSGTVAEVEQRKDAHRDVGGRVASGTKTEQLPTTPGMEEVESRREQRSRAPEAADAARKETKAASPSVPSEAAGKQPTPEGVSAAGGGALAAAETHEPEVAPEVKQLQAEIEVARAETAENLDNFLRAKAETENIRRRAETEVANARKYGVERFAAELLVVKDSLELARAVELKEGDTAAVQKMHEGLDLTLKLMDDVFRKFGLTAVDPKGEKFDPERHQAISIVESDLVAPNHVVTVVQKGYLLHERVLRPAMVTVSKGKPCDAQGSASAAGGRTP